MNFFLKVLEAQCNICAARQEWAVMAVFVRNPFAVGRFANWQVVRCHNAMAGKERQVG